MAIMASSYAFITLTPLSYRPKKYIQKLSSFSNGARIFTSVNFSGRCKIPGTGKHSWNYGESFELSAFSSSNGNWVEDDDEFVVVNFYRLVFVKNPQDEVSKHLSFMQGRDIHGRIYLNEQGVNAQYSGPYKDALAYVEWVKEDNRFSDILVQISPAINGHAFPKLKLRYKPSLVQLEEGTSHLPLLDPSMRATPLTPCEWRIRLEVVNKIDISLSTVNTKSILLDVRNGYEWDVGHFQGARRPDVDCFRSTSFGLSESQVIASDPLATVDRENTDILMYCTGGIRCDLCGKVFPVMKKNLYLRVQYTDNYKIYPRQKGLKRLYTLKGGVSHYLENEGSTGWVGNLFVFDSRLSLPPSIYNPEINVEASGKKREVVPHSFAKCYICGSQVSQLRHRNCANLDCNLLFLCCLKCVDDFRGCCCMKCTSAARLRPVLPGRYQKWHKYRDLESKLNPVH